MIYFNTQKCYILSTHNKSSHYYSLNNHILQQVDCSPCLEVTLTHDLRWTTHINNITRKASSNLGFLRQNLWFCPLSRLQEKTSLHLPCPLCFRIQRCSLGPLPAKHDTNELEKIQRCVARFINQNYKDRTPGCVTTMLRDPGLQSLQNRRKQQRLTLFFKMADPSKHCN